MDIEYKENGSLALFDGFKFRRDSKTGYYLSTKQTDIGRRERLHCYVWRYYNSTPADGFHVHHIDEDKSNNSIKNLCCIPENVHLSNHSTKRAILFYDEIVKNLADKARPKASEWHRSQEGRAFHSKQLKENIEKMKEQRYICQCCGEAFYKKPLGVNKYCSNGCRTKARYRSGVDNEIRMCEVCGRPFSCNKYYKTRACSAACGYILSWDKRSSANRNPACIQHGG